MIDICAPLLERLLRRLEETGEQVSHSSETNPVPARFPHLNLIETDDAVYRRTRTRQGEQHAAKLFTIEIYSNRTDGRKAEAERIFAVVDSEMGTLGFVRRSKTPLSNMKDATVYRIAARYSCVVDRSGRIYSS